MSLDQLQKIRSRRLESTYVEMQINRTQIEECQEHLEKVQRALVKFRVWKKNRQDELFDDLNSGSFSVDKVDVYNTELAKIDQQEVQMHEAIPKAEEALKVAEKRYADSKVKLQSVTKDLEKVKEFISVSEEEDKRALDKRDEQQSDELAHIRVKCP